MPPRHGKSQLVSRYTPAWYLSMFPDRRVLLASYEADFARTWGRKAREVMERWGPELFGISTRPESAAADRWDLVGREGGMATAGIGGPLTGKGADLAVIDDPVKNAEEAGSTTIQERNWDWWRSTMRTRLEPNGAVVLLMTRWHERDLAGMILEHEGDEWETITLPAFAKQDDLLGREPGEALWPERYPVDELERIKASIGTYWFNSMYQGAPKGREGTMFKRRTFVELEDHEVPQHKVATVRMWDLAATEKKTEKHDPDYTAGCNVSLTFNGLYVIEDMQRFRESPAKVEQALKNIASQDGYSVPIGIEQEPGAAGKSLIQHYQLNVLAGYPVFTEHPTGDKVTRAQSFSAFAEHGRVAVVKKPWNAAMYDELEAFPQGGHDDQVDCLAAAMRYLSTKVPSSADSKITDTRLRGRR
ncbi:MAG: phage terminase large subunit [Actinomycetota bacterium]